MTIQLRMPPREMNPSDGGRAALGGERSAVIDGCKLDPATTDLNHQSWN